MSTPLTNAANRARGYEFNLPTFGRGDVLLSYRPDPAGNLVRAVPTTVTNLNPARRTLGPIVPSITRSVTGETILTGHMQDAMGNVVEAPGLLLNVYRRNELTPVGNTAAATVRPGPVGAAVAHVSTNWKKIAVAAFVVLVGYHVFLKG